MLRWSVRMNAASEYLYDARGAALNLGGLFTIEYRLIVDADATSQFGAFLLDFDAGGDVSFGALQVILNQLGAGAPASRGMTVLLHANNQPGGHATSICGVPLGRPTMISIVHDATQNPNTHIYLNGTHAGSGHCLNGFIYPAQALMGRRRYNPLPDYFSGRIESIRLWNIARSQAAIQADYAAASPSTSVGLYRHWPMEEGAGLVTLDTVDAHGLGLNAGSIEWVQEDWTLTPYDECCPLREQIEWVEPGWRWISPAPAGTDWHTDPNYDDSAWAVGTSPFGGGSSSSYAPHNTFSTTWPDPAGGTIALRRFVGRLRDSMLLVSADDVATVWLNGTAFNKTSAFNTDQTFNPSDSVYSGRTLVAVKATDSGLVHRFITIELSGCPAALTRIRQRQRDDDLRAGGIPRNQPTSRQGSLRAGPRNTYR